MQRSAALTTTLVAAVASLILAAAPAGAQGAKPSYKREVPPKLAAKGRISEDSAAAIARGKVPNGKIQSVELEQEKGKLQYSFDVKIPGKSGIEEVNVDATDGSVIAVEHESPARGRKEASAEKKAKKPVPE